MAIFCLIFGFFDNEYESGTVRLSVSRWSDETLFGGKILYGQYIIVGVMSFIFFLSLAVFAFLPFFPAGTSPGCLVR